MSPLHPETERVLIRAPTGRDAALVCRILQTEGVRCAVCDGEEDFARELDRGAGAVIVGQEALDRPAITRIVSRLETQPLWSDVPILILTREASDGEGLVAALGPMVNVTLLERPVRIATLVSAVHAALRARRRQYEVRDLVDRLAESDRRKDEFLAMLGHELRNPLAAISTAVTLAPAGAGVPPGRRLPSPPAPAGPSGPARCLAGSKPSHRRGLVTLPSLRRIERVRPSRNGTVQPPAPAPPVHPASARRARPPPPARDPCALPPARASGFGYFDEGGALSHADGIRACCSEPLRSCRSERSEAESRNPGGGDPRGS